MLNILICFIIMLILQLIIPFWFWIMIVPFGYNIVRPSSGWMRFGIGAVSAGLLWLLGSLYHWLSAGEFIVQRVAIMIKFDSPWILIAAATLIAVLAGGFAGSSGCLFRSALRRN